jgi:predicted DNA binding CopG/RHH family protein
MGNLNSKEQEILDAFESGRLKQSKDVAQELVIHRASAEFTFKKDARINIRLSSKDLRALKTRALQEGISYQTLVSSILHKFVDGQLVEKLANQ